MKLVLTLPAPYPCASQSHAADVLIAQAYLTYERGMGRELTEYHVRSVEAVPEDALAFLGELYACVDPRIQCGAFLIRRPDLAQYAYVLRALGSYAERHRVQLAIEEFAARMCS